MYCYSEYSLLSFQEKLLQVQVGYRHLNPTLHRDSGRPSPLDQPALAF